MSLASGGTEPEVVYLDVYTVLFAVGHSLAEAAIVVAVADAVLGGLGLTGDWGDALEDESVHWFILTHMSRSGLGLFTL